MPPTAQTKVKDNGMQRAHPQTTPSSPRTFQDTLTDSDGAKPQVQKRGRGRPRIHPRDDNGKIIIEVDASGERLLPTQKYNKVVRAGGAQSSKPAPAPRMTPKSTVNPTSRPTPVPKRPAKTQGGRTLLPQKRKTITTWEEENEFVDTGVRAITNQEDVDAEGETDSSCSFPPQPYDSDSEKPGQETYNDDDEIMFLGENEIITPYAAAPGAEAEQIALPTLQHAPYYRFQRSTSPQMFMERNLTFGHVEPLGPDESVMPVEYGVHEFAGGWQPDPPETEVPETGLLESTYIKDFEWWIANRNNGSAGENGDVGKWWERDRHS